MNLEIMKITIVIFFMSVIVYSVHCILKKKKISAEKISIMGLALTLLAIVPLLLELPAEPTISVITDDESITYNVVITSPSGVDVYYNINHEEAPSIRSKKYEGAFTAVEGATIRAVAIDDFGFKSKESTTMIPTSNVLNYEERKKKMLKIAEWFYQNEEYLKTAEIYQSEFGTEDAIAMNNLGYLYAKDKIGKNQKKNREQAKAYFEKAFVGGEKIAGHNLVSLKIIEANEIGDLVDALEEGVQIYDDEGCKRFISECMKKSMLIEESEHQNDTKHIHKFLELTKEEKVALVEEMRISTSEVAEEKRYKKIDFPLKTPFKQYVYLGRKRAYHYEGSSLRSYVAYVFSEYSFAFEGQEELEPVFITIK